MNKSAEVAIVYNNCVAIYTDVEVYHLHKDEVVFGRCEITVNLDDGNTITASKDVIKYYDQDWEDEDPDEYDHEVIMRDEI